MPITTPITTKSMFSVRQFCMKYEFGNTDTDTDTAVFCNTDTEYRYRLKIPIPIQFRVETGSKLVIGAVDGTLAFGSIGRGFESEHRLFSHHSASIFKQADNLISLHGVVLPGHD